MPPLPVIPDTYRCAIGWNAHAGVIPFNVIHIHRAAATPTLVAADLLATLTNAMFSPMSGVYNVGYVRITPLDGVTATQTFALPGAVTGLASGQVVFNLAACINFGTTQRGSRGRGRAFIGPTTEDVNSGDNTWAGASQLALANAWQAFQAALLARPGTPSHVIASYVHADQHQVNSYFVDSLLRSCKSRLNQVT